MQWLGNIAEISRTKNKKTKNHALALSGGSLPVLPLQQAPDKHTYQRTKAHWKEQLKDRNVATAPVDTLDNSDLATYLVQTDYGNR
ncbi:hypothetical protein GCM10025751_58200 [Haladaptatus pallidirubidus]|uniref:Transposase n=1 Tax=Haladaptatus pallidirubidus TaxID=1008152 RepID=A0AAV3US11_9EURY